MLYPTILVAFSTVALATVKLQDPSDIIPASDWASDNALIADYNAPFPANGQPEDLVGVHDIKDKSVSVDHVTWHATKNDTSVVLVSKDADFAASYSTFVKSGYYSNLNWASFYGFNAAVNVVSFLPLDPPKASLYTADILFYKANKSVAVLDHVNITVHNGAANVYSYGTGTVVNVTNSWLYSSGPVSHGLYASGNGTIHAKNLQHYSGGHRSSAFSGDSPAGYIYVEDSVSRVRGIGSATYYALGEIHATNVASVAEQGPVVFSDGKQKIYLKDCSAQAGLLGGAVLFSSSVRRAGAVLDLEDTTITTTGKTMPGLWFGNVIADARLKSVQLNTASGILAVANMSQITQDFNYYGGYIDNPSMEPAKVSLKVLESSLSGDLVAYNKSSISLSLGQHSSWKGTARVGYKSASFGVSLDASSKWTLTADTTLQNFTNSDTSNNNIQSRGYNIYYNSSASANKWLKSRTIKLSGGGKLEPIRSRMGY
ncbi:hypothetical protein FANTH_6035 [Fusarium anthophilum]|uniref:Uncharacterized protein n=1 Tax=Fusarium anthophilum TaxID=48485 RepID=A0A8H5E685_9HYPO|nr:hypothetical protein FANTH_6035 [Fusarium anthophilum]